MNRELAARVVTLFGAGEVGEDAVAENAMDSSDIIRTFGAGGIASIGYASTEVGADRRGGLLSRFRGEDGDEPESMRSSTKASRLFGLVRRATKSRLTLPAAPESADRALVVTSGPPSALSRKGLESAREWLEAEVDTVEILAGDDPRPRDHDLSAVVLLANVTEAPRIKELQAQAVRAQDKIAELEAAAEGDRERLVADDGGELDPVI